MTRLSERFDLAKQMSVPDLSDELDRRLRDASPPPVDYRHHIGQRLLVGALAVVIFVAAGAFAWRAFRPATQETAAGASNAVLQVTCDTNSVQVSTPTVAAQSDGVHVVADTSGLGHSGAVMLQSVSEPQVTYASGSEGVGGEFARPVPVGEAVVWCGTAENVPRPADAATFTIIDPSGFFVDYRPACSNPEVFGHSPIPSLSQADAASPEDLVREVVSGLHPADEVDLAGYPDNRQVPRVRVVRDGSVVAFFITNEGLKFIDAGWICPSSGLSYPTQSR